MSFISNVRDFRISVTDIPCLPVAGLPDINMHSGIALLTVLKSPSMNTQNSQNTDFLHLPVNLLKTWIFKSLRGEDITTKVRSHLSFATILSIELPEASICTADNPSPNSITSGHSNLDLGRIQTLSPVHTRSQQHTRQEAMSDNPNERPPASAAADQCGSGGAARKPDTYGSGPVGPKETGGDPGATSEKPASTGTSRGGSQSSGSGGGSAYKSAGSAAEKYGH